MACTRKTKTELVDTVNEQVEEIERLIENADAAETVYQDLVATETALGKVIEEKNAEIERLQEEAAEGIGERGRLREENRERWDIAAVLGKDLKEATGHVAALEFDCDLLRKDLASARARAHDFETRLQGTLMSAKALGEGLSVRRTPK